MDRDFFTAGIMQLESGLIGEGTLDLLSSPNFRQSIRSAVNWNLRPESLEILRRVEREWSSAPEAPPRPPDPVGGSLALFRCGRRFLEGNPGQALAEASRAWSCYPTYRSAVACAHLLAHLELHNEALEMWEQALTLPEADFQGWCERGEYRLRLGDKQGALADLNRAVELAPDSHFLHSVRAHIYKSLGLYGLARKDEFQALRLRPEEPLRLEAPRRKNPPRLSATDLLMLLTFLLACSLVLRIIWLILREAGAET